MEVLTRLCIHTVTTKPWTLEECIAGFKRGGAHGITVWREALKPQGAKMAGEMLRDSGLEVVSLCRGGFFPAETEAARGEAVDDNRRAIDEAVDIGAPMVVLVCGAVPGMPLSESRLLIEEGIAAVLPHAEQANVKLAIEPLHPMYADSRSAINTMKQANDMAEHLDHPLVGVAADVYHLWWDPDLETEIKRCGERIFAFHVCDWRTPTRHLLTDRGLMGEGCINIPEIRGWVEAAGFNGFIEVEIFSDEYWAMDQADFVGRITQAYKNHV